LNVGKGYFGYGLIIRKDFMLVVENKMKGLVDLGCGVSIIFEGLGEMGFFFRKGLRRGDSNGSGNKGFRHDIFLRRMIMGVGTKVSINVIFLLIDLEGEEAIKEVKDKDVVLLKIHSELNERGNLIEIGMEGVEHR